MGYNRFRDAEVPWLKSYEPRIMTPVIFRWRLRRALLALRRGDDERYGWILWWVTQQCTHTQWERWMRAEAAARERLESYRPRFRHLVCPMEYDPITMPYRW